MTDMTPSDGSFELESERLGALPIVDHFFGRVGLGGRLERYLVSIPEYPYTRSGVSGRGWSGSCSRGCRRVQALGFTSLVGSS